MVKTVVDTVAPVALANVPLACSAFRCVPAEVRTTLFDTKWQEVTLMIPWIELRLAPSPWKGVLPWEAMLESIFPLYGRSKWMSLARSLVNSFFYAACS